MKPIVRFLVIIMSIIFGISWLILMIVIGVALPLLSVFEYIFRGTWTWFISKAETLIFDIMPDGFKEFTDKFINMFDKKTKANCNK